MLFFNAKPIRHLAIAREFIEKIIEGEIKSVYSDDNVLNLLDSIYNVDCSGFVRYILESANEHQAVREVLKLTTEKKAPNRIYTYDFFDFLTEIESGKIKSEKWKLITPHKLFKEGDIIVWVGDSIGSVHKEQSGHIGIINKLVSKKGEGYRVELIDAVQQYHFKDSRFPDKNGIGKGEIFLYPNSSGNFVAVNSSQERSAVVPKRVKIARLID